MQALRGLNFSVVAVGDSYNDTAMLGAADAGIFFHPPEAIAAEFPQHRVARTYDELAAAIEEAAGRLRA